MGRFLYDRCDGSITAITGDHIETSLMEAVLVEQKNKQTSKQQTNKQKTRQLFEKSRAWSSQCCGLVFPFIHLFSETRNGLKAAARGAFYMLTSGFVV